MLSRRRRRQVTAPSAARRYRVECRCTLLTCSEHPTPACPSQELAQERESAAAAAKDASAKLAAKAKARRLSRGRACSQLSPMTLSCCTRYDQLLSNRSNHHRSSLTRRTAPPRRRSRRRRRRLRASQPRRRHAHCDTAPPAVVADTGTNRPHFRGRYRASAAAVQELNEERARSQTAAKLNADQMTAKEKARLLSLSTYLTPSALLVICTRAMHDPRRHRPSLSEFWSKWRCDSAGADRREGALCRSCKASGGEALNEGEGALSSFSAR